MIVGTRLRNWRRKLRNLLLIAATLLLTATANADDYERIQKDGEIENVVLTIFWFDTIEDLETAFGEEGLQGYSECERYLKKNLAHCDLYVVRPTYVDDEETLTIGHEVLHGVYGHDYHEEVE
jgi:hypothetical protein